MNFGPIDIGHGHTIHFTSWRPDRELNPQSAHLPDVEHYGLIDDHAKPDGTPCPGGCIVFDGDVARRIDPDGARWTLVSLDPLTVTPSLLCLTCGDHGFITQNRWVPA